MSRIPTQQYLAAVSIVVLLLAASSCVTIGPKTQTEIVFVHAAQATRVAENKTIQIRPLDKQGNPRGEPLTQDIGGWVAMPVGHWLRTVEQISSLGYELTDPKEVFSVAGKAKVSLIVPKASQPVVKDIGGFAIMPHDIWDAYIDFLTTKKNSTKAGREIEF